MPKVDFERLWKIYEVVENNPGIPYAEVRDRVGLTQSQFVTALASMDYAGLLIGDCDPWPGCNGRVKKGLYALGNATLKRVLR